MNLISFQQNMIYRVPNPYRKQEYKIPTIDVHFSKWEGKDFQYSFGKKPLVDFNGIPLFAELAIQALTSSNGWDSRWVSTYAAPKDKPRFLSNWIDKPINEQSISSIKDDQANRLLQRIAERNNNNFSGCWDVFAWKDSEYLFLEAKRFGKDNIRDTQLRWLENGLIEGLSIENFLIVQWKFETYK